MSSETLNSLSRASSAYLRSAMHQPIQWHEWEEEAFATAQRENKPILLDIGAVWCHWCHVMDRESYDNPEIAQIINERFIAVKVDRDERPDVDSRYQIAVQAVSGQGGWPLTAFLTPDGKPFYGGTYFPPEDHYGRPSFKRVLLSIAAAYHEKKGDVAEQARMVENAVANAESFSAGSAEFSPAVIDAIVQAILARFDSEHGGFGSSPKFPHSAAIDLIIDRYVRTGDETLRNIFVTTLEKMARGGVYDQLAGGFHRYSVDERWIVPHFEKMSYDNSELLKNYVHAYQATGSEFFANVARDIIRWMDEWLSDRSRGGFYASQDADYSMDDDGDYFTWTLDEAKAALTVPEAQVANLHYDINEIGEMHHNPAKNVLFVRASVDEIAGRTSLSPERVTELLASAKAKMYAARLKRPTPYVDKTVYTGWNALCASAYFEAAKILNLDDVRHFALRSLDRVLSHATHSDGRLIHVIAYSDPASEHRQIPAVLDDYAFTAIACLDAYEATADLSYFKFARRIADYMLTHFYDSAGEGFFDTESDEGKTALGVLGTRRKPFQDSPTPAGNSAAAIALLRLHGYTNEAQYRERAEKTLEILAGFAGQYGLFAGTYGVAAVHLSQPHTQVVVLGSDDTARRLYAASVGAFQLGKAVICLAAENAVPQNLPPALAATLPHLPAIREGRTAAVICANFACRPPIFEPEVISEELGGKKLRVAS
jgi:uncharacterized protein YyaL (SSP411 family)